MVQLCVLVLLSGLPAEHLANIAMCETFNNGRVAAAPVTTAGRVQRITDDLRARLEILERVHVELVDNNPLVMSVETLAGRSGPFVIRADENFIEQLSEGELEAALAHELGHIWIYTHHPYIQSERLANDVAMRVVRRTVLEPLYEKVWRRIGIQGNLIEFIGEPDPKQ